RDSQCVGQRDLKQQEPKEIQDGGGEGVSRSIEGLEYHHAIRVADVAYTDDSQAGGGEGNDGGVGGEQANDWPRKQDQEHTFATQKQHVIETGFPNRSLRPLGLLGAEIL